MIKLYSVKNRSQLKNAFQSPLYSFQRALARLEKGSIVISHQEGKTLIYQFNPRYPFLNELKAFLEKGYDSLREAKLILKIT